MDEFPFQFSPSFDIPIRIKLDGLTYGVGGTAAIGTPKYFASLDVNYTRTDFNQLASELYVIVAAPRVGMVIDRPCYKGEIHLGAMYQYAKQTVEVELDLPSLGDLDVTVTQYEPRKWNFLIGTLWAIDERLHAVVELGAGGRQYVISSLTMWS